MRPDRGNRVVAHYNSLPCSFLYTVLPLDPGIFDICEAAISAERRAEPRIGDVRSPEKEATPDITELLNKRIQAPEIEPILTLR